MIPLKIISDYSLGKSLIKIDDLITFLNAKNIKVCGLCDNELFGSLEFYNKCKANNIKPIIGLDITLENKKCYVYAKDYADYKKLLKINSNKNNITYDDIQDLIVVLPYESLDIYSNFKNKNNIYLAYQNLNEKNNELMLSNQVIYLKEIIALTKDDFMYSKYLPLLNENIDIQNCFYYEEITDSDDIKRLNDFSNLFNLDIPFKGRYIPKYNENSAQFLKNLIIKGLSKRLNGNIPENYQKRINEEYKVISQMGFIDYFLIVYDYVLYAKKNNIMVGPGRGSAAGSLISYAIGITDVDPIKYDLMFARFLNPARSKMPDIDIDFEDTKRSEIISYVKQKYGENNVAVGLTFTTYKAKLILRDLARIFKINGLTFDKFISEFNASLSLKDNLQNDKIKKYLDIYPEYKNLVDIAFHFEYLRKNISTHAAGVVISSIPLNEVIPTYEDENGLKTGIEMNDTLEKMGLLKMDFLALNNLTILHKLEDECGKITDFNEQRVYEVLSSGDSDDIFQFESRYAKEMLRKIKPQNFEELCIATALVRPGPNNQVDTYVKNKNEGYTLDTSLKEILSSTYGVIIFQEQVMNILMKIASYSPYEADNIRAAMSKKKENIINAEEKNFISRAIKNGYSNDFASDLFSKIKKFAEYGFNKAHSVSYTMIVYKIAYYKIIYPKEFAKVMLQSGKDSESKKKYLDLLKNNNVKILKPNINKSTNEYLIKNDYLLLPFNVIKGLNSSIINKIIDNRPYEDIFDFFVKNNDLLNEKLYNLIVYSGILEPFGLNQRTLIENYESIKNYIELNDLSYEKPMLKEYPEYELPFLREKENEIYGMYIGMHPCGDFKNVIKIKDLNNYVFKNVKVGLIIEYIKKIKTKKGDDMAFVKASDETGNIELTIFHDTFVKIPNLNKNDLVLVTGKCMERFEKLQIIVDNLEIVYF